MEVSRYASDGDYEITCDSISSSTGVISNSTPGSCLFNFTPNRGDGSSSRGSIRVAYRSAGGATRTATLVPLEFNLANSLFWRYNNFPTQSSVAAGRSVTIDFTGRIWTHSNRDSAISALTQPMSDPKITIARRGCRYIITAGATQGSAPFVMNFGVGTGHTYARSVTVTIQPPSNIVFTAPTGLKVGRNRTLEINASDHAADGTYAITCGDATGVDNTKLTAVTRNGCVFTVDPIDTLAAGSQGDTSSPCRSLPLAAIPPQALSP